MERTGLMAQKNVSIYPGPDLEAAIVANGGGRGRSHRINQIADRYAEILRRNQPSLSEPEWNLIRDSLNGTLHEPAAMIGGVWQGVEDSLADGLGAKWGVDGPELVRKLRGLSFAQEVALVEAIEAWWAERANAGAA